MSEEKEKTTFTPAEAAEWLQIDYSTFVLQWLPGYARFLSESARQKEPILTQLDLALLEQVVAFQAQGRTHRQIRAVLSRFWKPELQQKVLPALVQAVAAKQRAARRK